MSPTRSTQKAGFLKTSKEPAVVGSELDNPPADGDSEDSATEVVTRLAQRMISSVSIYTVNSSSCSRSTYHYILVQKASPGSQKRAQIGLLEAI